MVTQKTTYMKKRSAKKRANYAKPAPPPPQHLSFKWFTEEQMFELFGATKAMLRKWHELGLPLSQPTGRQYYNETDVQEFMIKKRRKPDNEG